MRLGVLIAAGVLALVLLVLLLLHTPPAQRYVLARVTALLADRQIGLTSEALSYNLLGLSLDLRNVTVRSEQAPDLPAFARVGRLQVQIDLFALLRGRYVVREGSLDDLDVHLVVDGAGRDNVPRPPETAADPDEASAGEPVDYLIDQFAVSRARVRYEDRAQAIDVLLPVTSIVVDGSPLTGRHAVELEAGDGVLQLQDRRTAIQRLTAMLDLGPDDVRVTEMSLLVDGARLALSGDVTGFGQPELDLAAQVEVALDEAAAFGGLTERVEGLIRAEATVRGPVNALIVAATVDAADLSARTLDDVRLSAGLGYSGEARRVTIDDLQVSGPMGRLTLEGTVALDADAGDSQIAMALEGLDLALLMRAADLDYLVASRASGRVSATLPGLDYEAAAGGARVTLTPVGRPAANVVPVVGTIDVEVSGPQVTAQLIAVQALGARADGRIGLLDREGLTGTVSLRADDLASVIAGAEAVLAERPGTLVGTPLAGAATVQARLGGTIAAPEADLALLVPSLAVGPAAEMQIGGDLSYSPRVLEVHDLEVAWQAARVHVAGTVGLQDARPLQLEVAASQLAVEEVLRALDQSATPASGTVGATASVGGTVDRPRGQVTLRAFDLVAYNEPLGVLTADVVIDEQSVAHADVRLEKAQPDDTGVLSAEGTYDLDSGRFDVAWSSAALRLVSLVLPGEVGVRARLDLEGRAQGTRDDPSASVRLVAEDLDVGGDPFGRIAVQAAVAERRARIQASADRFTVEANADIGIGDGYPATVEAVVRDLDLGTLPLPPDTPLAGRLRARLEAAGELTSPEAGSGVATIEGMTASWSGQPLELEGPATVRYSDQRIAIERFVLHAQRSTVSLAGDLPIRADATDGAIEIDARLDLATLAGYAPPEAELAAAGTAALVGRITGSLHAIDPTLTLTVADAAISAAGLDPGLTDLRARLEVSNGALQMPELSAALGQARLVATAHVPLAVLPEDLPVDLPRADGEARLRAEIAELDLATLPGGPDGLAGSISMVAEVGAPRPDLAAVAGDIVFPVLEVAYETVAFAQEGTSRIVIAQGVATMEQMTLAGSAGRLEVRGSVGLAGEQALDVAATGRVDIAALSAFVDDLQADGPVALELTARGTVADPLLDGFIEVSEARIARREPSVAIEDLYARIDLSRQQAVLSRLSGNLNGGELSGSGAVGFAEGTLTDIDLGVTVDGMAFDEPLGLRSLLDADVRVGRQGDLFVLGGQVIIQEAGLTQDLALDTGLLGGLAGPPSLDLTTERNPLVERVRFDLMVTTATPVLLDNNLARGEMTADLRVLGTPYEPGMSGRLVLQEDSVVTLNERPYVVERGIITFIEERRIAPVFDLRLTTRAGTYDVVLQVSGPPGDTETQLTSEPGLPEPDILALLVTGRTLEEMRGEEYEVARTQVLSYVSGRAGASLGRGLERATGLSRVRLEPNLIAGEADPGARLTVGQDLTRDLRLIYSTDLVNSGDEIWIAEYDVTRRFQAQTVRQSDASYRFDVRHDVRFGGTPEPRRAAARAGRTVGDVRLEGEPIFDAREVLDRFGVSAGATYNFFDVRRGAQRVEEQYRRRGYLQSRVRVRRADEGDRVHLTMSVTAGPRVQIAYTGVQPPAGVRRDVEQRWVRGVFDAQRTGDGERVLREWLVGRNYFASQLAPSIEEPSPGQRLVTFRIDPGPRFRRLVLEAEGARGIAGSELVDIVREQRLQSALFTDASQVTRLLEGYYREQGYLSASVAEPRFELSPPEARVILPVEEGPRFVIREVEIDDNLALSSQLLLAEVPLRSGDPYLPAVAERSVARIRELYGALGYNDANASYVLGVDPDAGVLDVAFVVAEGRREVVAVIDVDGNDQTSDRLVSRQLALASGAPLAIAELGQSRRNLYDTRAFTLVDILREEVPSDALEQPAAGPDARPLDPAADKPVRVTVSVREVQPFQIRYGGFYDTERGPGGIVDFTNHNSLGSARVAGLRLRYDAQLQEGRLSLSQPSLAELPLESAVNLFYVQERRPAVGEQAAFNLDRAGFSVQQEARLRDSYVLSYGYRLERQHTYDPSPARLHDDTTRVSPLTTTLTRETRDDVLDSSRGQFMSHALSISPGFLGSDVPYLKYFGQFFTYRALEPERRERFTNEILRPRFVYAAGVRLGLARGLGDGRVPTGERFLAGGGTTLRGFAQDSVGQVESVGEDGLVIGGEAMFVVNNEIRFPLFSRFDGVAFLDVGNVFDRVAAASFSMRSAGGVGLRVRTPWFLGRLDWGFPFDRRSDEARSVLFFSIGQAF